MEKIEIQKLVNLTPKGGEVIYNENDKSIIEILEKNSDENLSLIHI